MIKSDKSTPTLVNFRYTGVNHAGQKITSDIKARNLVLAKIDLRKQGIIIKKIIKKNTLFVSNKHKKISSGDIAVLSRQLATLFESGIPIVQSLAIIAKGQTNTRLNELVERIKQDIETGLTLSEALQKHPIYFNSLFCNLVDAGEKSGSLDVMLHKIALYKEKTESLKKKIKKTLTYPTAVLIIALIITSGLLVFVVPQFEALFQGFGAELPTLTKAVVYASHFFQLYWYLIFASLASVFYVFLFSKKNSPVFLQKIDRILLKLPIIGTVIEKAVIARFSRTLSITFAAGLPLVNALNSVSGATGNTVFADATHTIKNGISIGQEINKSMAQTKLFPSMVIQMVAIGEETGTLEKMLSKVADFYEEEVDNSVDSLNSLLEPIIMSLLGILVGGLIIAMYLPIFKLGAAI